MNAAFGEDYSLNLIWSRDPAATGWDGFAFRHGYALVDGEVRGLKSGRMRATRRSGLYVPAGYEGHVVDVDDREHHLVGIPVMQFPWRPYTTVLAPHSGIRWHTREGDVGFGLAQELVPLDSLGGARFKTDAALEVTA